jgi:hypothetical protein
MERVMTSRLLPPIDFLRECFSYDPVDGIVRWKHRPAHHFTDLNHFLGWNTVYPGTSPPPGDDGYIRFRVSCDERSFSLAAHVIAYALTHGAVDFGEIDHRNVAGSDNRLVNLRPATRSQNNANRRGHSKSGLPKGVSFLNGKFVAYAHAGKGKTAYLGRHATVEAAHAAYCEFAQARHGEFFNAGPQRASVFD